MAFLLGMRSPCLSGPHSLLQGRMLSTRTCQLCPAHSNGREEGFVFLKFSPRDEGDGQAIRCPTGATASTGHPRERSDCSPERKTLSQREGGRGQASSLQPIWEPTLFSLFTETSVLARQQTQEEGTRWAVPGSGQEAGEPGLSLKPLSYAV